jgi:hypothetical protein
LLNGHYISGKGGKQFVEATTEEKTAAQKILAFATAAATGGKVEVEPLTNAERKVAISKSKKYVVKSGFLDRAASYCKSAAELRALLSVVSPQQAVSSLKFGKSDSKKGRNARLVDVFSTLVDMTGGDVKEKED